MFNNTTYEICLKNTNYDKSLYITNIIWQVSGFFGVFIGLPGHILQIIILSKKTSRKESSSIYFIAIAICEIIFLLGLFWLWCANMAFVKLDPRQIFSCGIFYSIVVGSTTLSNLYLASMSIDTIILILRPARYRLYVTQSRILIRLLIIFFIVLILLIPHHFYFYYEPRTTLFFCDFHSFVTHQQIGLWSLMHAILFVSIPSLIVCLSSFVLLHNRCKHKRLQKNNLSKNARRMHNHSIFIVFISIGILLSLVPACILEIFIVHDRFFYHDKHCSIRWKVYKILLNCFLTLLSITYSNKFYIHLMISTTFRKNFIQFITCKSNGNVSNSIQMNNGSQKEQALLQPNELSQGKAEEIHNEVFISSERKNNQYL